jgi:hypothetical protein
MIWLSKQRGQSPTFLGCYFLKALFQPQKYHFKAKKQPSFDFNPLTGVRLAWSDPTRELSLYCAIPAAEKGMVFMPCLASIK